MCVNIREERQGEVRVRGLLFFDADNDLSRFYGGENITEKEKDRGGAVSKLALVLSFVRLIVELLR